MKIPLIYALHSGNLYGTERMALYTARGLSGAFDPVIMAPPGPALAEARASGYDAIPFETAGQFSSAFRSILAANTQLAFLATGVMQSMLCLAWNKLYRRRIAHLHLVHGGASEALSYGRKRRLNGQPVRFVAVSSYVRERLIANGVRDAQIRVIENFQPDSPGQRRSERPLFDDRPLSRLIVISRLDPEKRVDLLLEALEREPNSNQFRVRIFGTGWQTDELKQRAIRSNLNVVFEGFSDAVREALADSDLLVHLCPVEPFGLAIIEAMAAGVPVLVPDAGGAGSLVQDGFSGFRFPAGNAPMLMDKIRRIACLPACTLNGIVRESRRLLETRFSPAARINDYRTLLMETLV